MSLLRGRFDGDAAVSLARFASSIEIDLQMFDEDIDGSIAHATMLASVGLVTADEAKQLCAGLEEIRIELRDGAFRPGDDQEDIHMAIEARLTDRLGGVGKKLHTARSRNDQVATDVRLWLKRRVPALDAAIGGLIGVLLDRVEHDGQVVMPGYTHLQRGQPILLGHHVLAHAWSLKRDRGRLRDALARLDRSPLGACALAGTSLPIDREQTARALGFAGPVENAMDAVAARDHVMEVVAASAICATHLTRMAEELVLWSSSEVRFVRLADAHSTGSSIMPHKRNPDGAELVRGRAARVCAAASSLMFLVKSLPLAYNRDLQEDRVALFDAVTTTLGSVEMMTAMWRELTIAHDRFEEEMRGDLSLATELADRMVAAGVPFRDAYTRTAELVRACDGDAGLAQLDPAAARAVHPALAEDLDQLLDPRAAAERKTSLGGTAWSEIERQVALLRADC